MQRIADHPIFGCHTVVQQSINGASGAVYMYEVQWRYPTVLHEQMYIVICDKWCKQVCNSVQPHR